MLSEQVQASLELACHMAASVTGCEMASVWYSDVDTQQFVRQDCGDNGAAMVSLLRVTQSDLDASLLMMRGTVLGTGRVSRSQASRGGMEAQV